jgi:serine/threonine protein kinase
MLRLLRQVKQLHAHGVLHLDLKLDNIALDSRWGVRLIDFGLARPRDDPHLSTCRSGTPGFCDPSRGRTEASDVYSLGCVLYCLLASARSVFQVPAWREHYYELEKHTQPNAVQEFFADLQTSMVRDNPFRPRCLPSEHAADLLARMLRRDASARYSIDQCIKHPWFTSVDDDAAFTAVLERVTETLEGEMQQLADEATLSVRNDLGVGSDGGEHVVGGGLLRVVFPPVPRK